MVGAYYTCSMVLEFTEISGKRSSTFFCSVTERSIGFSQQERNNRSPTLKKPKVKLGYFFLYIYTRLTWTRNVVEKPQQVGMIFRIVL